MLSRTADAQCLDAASYDFGCNVHSILSGITRSVVGLLLIAGGVIVRTKTPVYFQNTSSRIQGMEIAKA